MTKIIKYRASKYGISEYITPVEIEKETEKSVWVNGRRSAKYGRGYSYYDSFDEAKKYLIEVAESKLRIAKSALAAAEAMLEKIHSLKPNNS